MIVCPRCGAEIAEEKHCCPFCGAVLDGVVADSGPRERPDMPIESEYCLTANIPGNKRGSILWFVPGFLIPLVGIALFLVWRYNKPRAAAAAGLGAFVSIVLSLGYIFFAVGIMQGII